MFSLIAAMNDTEKECSQLKQYTLAILLACAQTNGSWLLIFLPQKRFYVRLLTVLNNTHLNQYQALLAADEV